MLPYGQFWALSVDVTVCAICSAVLCAARCVQFAVEVTKGDWFLGIGRTVSGPTSRLYPWYDKAS